MHGKRAVRRGAGPVGEALEAATDALAAARVATPRLDASLLLGSAIGLEPARIAADPELEISPAAARQFGGMVRRRLRREPVAYILGRVGFRRIELQVDRRVLIPRPETELLVEVALELGPETVLDLGTGSGAVALAIAEELSGCEVTATDTSGAALEVARANAERLGLAERVSFVEGAPAGQRFDLAVANLPYVAETEWASLEPEITRWEPPEALLAGPDGLDAFRAVIPAIRASVAALEVGQGQAAPVTSLLCDAGFTSTDTRPDLAGIARVVVARR